MMYYNKPTDDFTLIIDTKLGFIAEIVTHDDLDRLQFLKEKEEYRSWYDLVKDYPTVVPSLKRQLMEDIRNKKDVKDARMKLAHLSPYKKAGAVTGESISRAKDRQIREFVKVPVSKKILCLFHTDKVPSMHIYPRSYYCFSCGAHGSTIDFIMKLHGKTFKESVLFLN